VRSTLGAHGAAAAPFDGKIRRFGENHPAARTRASTIADMSESRRMRIGVQLLIGWMPMWALFTVLMSVTHGMRLLNGAAVALQLMVIAAALGVLVHRLTLRVPWPHPFRARFLLLHIAAAFAYAAAWTLLNNIVEGLVRGKIVLVPERGAEIFIVTGMWLYVMVAGVSYAFQAAERESQLKVLAARSQLSMLRAQLHPHFLFNALHTVVQLIPLDQRAAVHAAEQLAGLLRTTLEETRDVVALADEWALVQRYLAIERIRFGDRLQVDSTIAVETLTDTLPTFSLQTLVENAVRHAAAPVATPTTLKITTRREGRELVVEVADDGAGASAAQLQNGSGTGLPRLRERLATLYDGARLDFRATVPRGVTATLRVPQAAASSAAWAENREAADD